MSDPLILVPTRLERDLLFPLDPTRGTLHGCVPSPSRIEVCGFGPVAAGIQTTRFIEADRPDRIILIGIAGSLSGELVVGEAYTFSQVAIAGLGVNSSTGVMPPSKIGFPQLEEDRPSSRVAVYERLSIAGSTIASAPGTLLTVCSSSGSESDASQRRQTFPDAVAEDMEGFAVALACDLAAIPLTIIRGISNQAGRRDKREWQIDRGLDAARQLLTRVLHET